MAKVISLKPLVWQNTKDGVLSTFIGAEIMAFRNAHGKYTACISVPGKRPETETAFDSLDEAKRYAEFVLLPRELSRYFVGF